MDELLDLIQDTDPDDAADMDNLKSFVEANTRLLNEFDKDTGTPLMFCYFNDVQDEIIELLLSFGPNLEVQDKKGKTVLFYAIGRAKDYGSVHWIDHLFKNGAGPNVNHKNKMGSTALHHAARLGYLDGVKFLIDKGADVNVVNNDGYGYTPLAVNILKEEPDKDIIKFLLEKGAKIEYTGATGYDMSILLIALTEDVSEVAELLVDAGANVNVVDPTDEGNDDTPLMIAIRKDFDDSLIRKLIEKGADVNAANMDDDTPLLELMHSKEPRLEIARLLLEKGAGVNVINDEGKSPLIFATINEQVDLVKLLLEKGADKDVEDEDGKTARDYAEESGNAELLALFGEEAAPTTGELWKGYSQSDAQLFDSIVANAEAMNKKTFCPICLQYTEWGTDCKYLTHKCKPALRHERLYNLYKDERGNIVWCAVCGRHCIGHAHYKLTDTTETSLPPRMPYQPGANVYKAESCPLEGGGGPEEKIRRVDGLLRYVCEVQDQVGKRPAKEVREELIEEAWKAASSRIPKTVEDIKKGLKFKTYCDLPTSLTAAATVAAEIPNPNIGSPEVRENDMCTVNLDTCTVYVFKHKQPDGSEFIHDALGKEALVDILRQRGGEEGCPIFPGCKGMLHPDEIKAIFEDEPQVYTEYKERFDRRYQTGGAKGGNVTSPMDDVECALPESKKRRLEDSGSPPSKRSKGGKTYRRIKKTRRGKRGTYRRRL
jgi:ankyrin repeat protein